MSCDHYPQPGHTNPTADESGSLPVADLHPEFVTSMTVAGLGGFVLDESQRPHLWLRHCGIAYGD